MSDSDEERKKRVQAIKHTVLTLADEHRASCGPNCTVSLHWLGVLLDMANIGVTAEEAQRLM